MILCSSQFIKGEKYPIRSKELSCNIFSYSTSKSSQSLVLCVQSLNGHHFLNTVPNIEFSNILSKFAGLDLRVVKKILDQRTHDMTSEDDTQIPSQPFVKLFNNFIKKLLCINIINFDFLKSFIQVLFQDVLSCD